MIGASPKDSKILIQEQPINILEDDKDKSMALSHDPDTFAGHHSIPSPNQVSTLKASEMNKINYIDMLDSASFSSEYKANLINLMNMGFMDFDKNLAALQKNSNNLELTCSEIVNKY